MYPKSNDDLSDDPAEIPSTPVQRRVAPLLKPGKPRVSRSSSITSSDVSDYAESPLKNRTAARNETSSIPATRIKAFKAAVILDEPKEEPLAKKPKGRKTFNSACAADDLASFAPDHNASPVGSPRSSLSDSSVSDTTSPPPKVVMTKKRKLEEIKSSEDLEFTAVKEKSATLESRWEPVDESYSRRKTNNRLQYRCTLCFEKNKLRLCNREGDMTRHLQSLKHRPKSFFCPNSGCSSTFTRQDALKRHLNKCIA